MKVNSVLKSDFFFIVIISVVVAVIFLTYFATLGKRLTIAQDLFLQANAAFEKGDLEAAEYFANESNAKWHSKKTDALLININQVQD